MLTIGGTWVVQWVKAQTLDFDSGGDLRGLGLSPRLRLHAQCSAESLPEDSLSFSLGPSACMLSLSL